MPNQQAYIFIAAVNQGKNSDDFPLTDAQRSELGDFNVLKC
jgi:cytochrome c peroxidase